MAEQENKPAETTGKEVSESRTGQFLSPFDDFDQWFDEIRRNWMHPLFFGRNWPEAGSVFGGRVPRVDVIDRDDEVCVRAELPGVTKDNLDVSLQESVLTIRATTQKEEREEKGLFHRREMSRGEFQRTLRLPGPVQSDQVKATFKDGVLELILPKAPGFKRQSIKVE
jgi:HSP20 family protein